MTNGVDPEAVLVACAVCALSGFLIGVLIGLSAGVWV